MWIVMPLKPGNVFAKVARLTEADFRAIFADTVRRLERDHSRERIALEAGCDTRTIENALTGRCTIKAHTLFNLLALDATALDDLLGYFGGHFTPIEAGDGPGLQLLSDTASLMALHSEAMASGQICHRKEPLLKKAARKVVQGWAAFITRKAA